MPREPSPVPADRERLAHMLSAAQDATSYVAGRNRADLDTDSMLLRALTHCVQEIGEAAARISDESQARVPGLPWAKIVGMRHILVHAYYSIDRDAVWRVVQEHLPGLIQQAEMALSKLARVAAAPCRRASASWKACGRHSGVSRHYQGGQRVACSRSSFHFH